MWVVIDCSMLVAVIALQAWPLTGVPLHEWLAIGLLAAVVAHLLLHWSWVEKWSRRILAPGTARARVNYALNLTLFLSMTAAMASGFAISKVVLPLHLTPDEYLKWHGIHEFSSRVVVSTAVYAIDRVMPRPDIMLITRDGRRIEHAVPPPDIAKLRRDEITPSARGIPPFVVQSIAVAVIAVIGRKVLRLRLD